MPHKTLQARREYMREYRRKRGVVPRGSPEHREKVSAGITEHWKTRERRAQSGEKNTAWKGDNVGWNAIHWWLRRNFPKERKCEECGIEGKTDYAFLHHPRPYTRVREDYRELCRRCHLAFDGSCKP
jgi:hypothetical protein